MEYVYKAPKYTHGNRCGHVPEFPRLYENNSLKTKYDSIEIASKSIKAYYYDPSKYLKEIKLNRYNRDENDKRIVWAKNKHRSESREAVCLVLDYLVHHCDMSTHEAIRFEDGKRIPPTLSFLAMFFSMSYTRVYRALKILRESGYITLVYQSRYIGKKFVKIPAIKYISDKLFLACGISMLKLSSDTHFATTRHEKRKHGQTYQKYELIGKDNGIKRPLQAFEIIKNIAENVDESTLDRSKLISNTMSILGKFKKQ